MTSDQKFPDILFLPPSDWGDFDMVLTEAEVTEMIKTMSSQGGRENISAEDCEIIYLERIISDDLAMYDGELKVFRVGENRFSITREQPPWLPE
ncbi:MAG: hypothetical protein HQK60_09830 [Deltaproteobacteria bacterium]|nr:hypothetical protein [Deltaproteobacteria bacterium]